MPRLTIGEVQYVQHGGRIGECLKGTTRAHNAIESCKDAVFQVMVMTSWICPMGQREEEDHTQCRRQNNGDNYMNGATGLNP